MADFNVQPPYFGAAYYPEAWPADQIDFDIEWMRKAGFNVMRVAEFAWARMEPREGHYEFDWLHRVVDKLGAAGIATMMGTPSATPPHWLTARYPEVHYIHPDGLQAVHGGRRHTCPNSPTYRDLCAKIVHKMGEAFGADERVIGWQIDNEVAPHNDRRPGPMFSHSCTCPVCRARFADFMRERYGTIEALNEAWCLNLWSQKYDDFGELPVPDCMWHHPALLEAWSEFSSHSWCDFVRAQAEILREHTKTPIGTDMMPFHIVDHYACHRDLDVVQINHYNYREGFRDIVLWFDYLRPVKGAKQPFWNTETSTCWSGSTTETGYSQPGFCRANSWLPIATGGEANLFWLWRTHWAGQELTHGSVMYTCGRPRHIFGEVQEVARGFDAARAFINGTYPAPTGMALHFTPLAQHILQTQPPQPALDYAQTMLHAVYHPLIRAQWRFDVIHACVDLAPYKLIFSPLLPALDDEGLRERLRAWIKAGGIWIAGPWTDKRTTDGAKFRDRAYGSLEEWGGIYVREEFPPFPQTFRIKWTDGLACDAGVYYDAFEPRGAETLAGYTERELAGLAAITSHPLGRGRVIALGTLPAPEHLVALVARCAAEAGLTPVAEAAPNVLVVPRAGAGGRGFIAVELDNEPGWVETPEPGTELLTGEHAAGRIALPPYGVAVVHYG